MSFHLRYTPYESTADITNAVSRYDRYIVARETKTKEGQECPLHYHCYIESDLDMDSIRVDVIKKLEIPKSGRGRNNRYYMLKKWNDDIGYIVKQGDIVTSKGFSQVELDSAVSKEINKNKEKSIVSAPPAPIEKKERDNMWKIIMEEAMIRNLKDKKEIDIEEALRIISRVYIKRLLPLPHPADRKRWSRSLVLYGHIGWGEKDAEEEIEKEMCEFIGEYMMSSEHSSTKGQDGLSL